MKVLNRPVLWVVFGGLLLLRLPISLLVNVGNLSIMRHVQVNDAMEVSLPLFEAMHLLPKNAKFERIYGISFFLKGEFKSATRYLRNANELHPDDVATVFWLGKAYEASGRYVDALVAMHQIGIDDYFPILSESMPSEDMIRLSREVLCQPTSTHAKIEMAKRVYSIDNRLARELFEQAFISDPDNLESTLTVAWYCFHNDDYDCAEKFADRAVEQFPDNPLVYLFLGTLNRKRGYIDLAEHDLYYAINLTSNKEIISKVYIELGRVYLSSTQYDSALECLASAVQFGGTSFSTYLLSAQAHYGVHNCRASLAQLDYARNLIVTQEQKNSFVYIEGTINKECH